MSKSDTTSQFLQNILQTEPHTLRAAVAAEALLHDKPEDFFDLLHLSYGPMGHVDISDKVSQFRAFPDMAVLFDKYADAMTEHYQICYQNECFLPIYADFKTEFAQHAFAAAAESVADDLGIELW